MATQHSSVIVNVNHMAQPFLADDTNLRTSQKHAKGAILMQEPPPRETLMHRLSPCIENGLRGGDLSMFRYCQC